MNQPDDESPPPPIPVVDYDTPRVDQVSRRRYTVVLMIAIVSAAIFGLAIMLLLVRTQPARIVTTVAMPAPAPASAAQMQAQQNAQQAYYQQLLDDALSDPTPATTIVYEEEPVNAMRLFTAGAGMAEAARRNMSQPLWGAFQPPVYRQAPFEQDRENKAALLFAHERTSSGGNTRLVLMEMEIQLVPKSRSGNEHDIQIKRRLRYRICEDNLLGNSPRVLRYGQSLSIEQSDDRGFIPVRWSDGTLRADRSPQNNLRIFAGQPDANDRSHFTIDYTLGGKRNTIDGWLTDDDFLRIIPRGGAVEGGTWRIDGDAPRQTTQPAEANPIPNPQ
jgi:hypothetical protein